MSVAEISEQLNLTCIKDHGWHIQVSKSTFWFSPVCLKLFCPSACYYIVHVILSFGAFLIVFALPFFFLFWKVSLSH